MATNGTTRLYGGMNGCQAIDAIVADHGHAEPIRHLAASLGWNANREGQARQEQLAKVVELLTEAGELMGRIESGV